MHLISAAAGIAIASTGHSPKMSPIAYDLLWYHRARYHVVTADLNSGMVEARTVHSPKLISVWNLLGAGHPVAAITGTFFSPRSAIPVADVLVDGNLVAKGSRGSAIGVDYYGAVKIFHESFHKQVDWADYKFGLRGMVMVVENGRVCPDPKAQKFHDRRLWGRAARTAIGTTKSGKLVMMATKSKITLSELGRAMKARGVEEGVSLDGGGSTCLYYKGSLLVPPTRRLSNMFVLGIKADGDSSSVAADVGATALRRKIKP